MEKDGKLVYFPRYISKQPYYILPEYDRLREKGSYATTYKGLSYILRVLYAPKLEGTKPPGLPLVGPTRRFKAATPQYTVTH